MKSRLCTITSACSFALITTLSSASVGQPLKGHIPEVPGGNDYQAYVAGLISGDVSSMPVAVWVVVIGLIGLVGIARRKAA